jgi:hypothetical protein
MPVSWESELTSFLTQLSSAQELTLDVLARKRELLKRADLPGLEALAIEEAKAVEGLQACLEQRQRLLQRAAEEGLPSDSLRSLAAALPDGGGPSVDGPIREAALRSRLLQHQSLVNWVLVQRTLLHLSQLLEIIATGGRLQPTYRKEESCHAIGALVDRAA